MATRKTEDDTERSLVKLLTLRDLITIISVAVSLALAWGVFSTRIALLESSAVERRIQIEEMRRTISQLETNVRDIDTQAQKNSLYIDQLLRAAGQTPHSPRLR